MADKVEKVIRYNGKTYRVRVPADWTAEDIYNDADRALGAYNDSPPSPESSYTKGAIEDNALAPGSAAFHGLTKSITDMGYGIQQAAQQVLPESIAGSKADLDKSLAYNEEQYAPWREQFPVMSALGEASSLLLAPQRIAPNLAMAAGEEGLKPGDLIERASNALAGGAGAALGYAIPAGMSKIGRRIKDSLTPNMDATSQGLADLAQSMGIGLDLGQRTGIGWIKKAGETIKKYPITAADKQIERERLQAEQFQRAAFDRIGGNKEWEFTPSSTTESLNRFAPPPKNDQLLLSADGTKSLGRDMSFLLEAPESKFLAKYPNEPEFIPKSIEELSADLGKGVTIDGSLSKVKVPAGDDFLADPATMGRQKNRIGTIYNEVLSRNPLVMTPNVRNDIMAIRRQYLNGFLVGDPKKKLLSYVNDLMTLPDGYPIPGHSYQNIKSKLGKAATPGTDEGTAFNALKNTLKKHYMDSMANPEDAALLKKIEKDKAGLSMIEESIADKYRIDPTKFDKAVRDRDYRNLNRSYGTGNQEFIDLARVGREFIRDPFKQEKNAFTSAFNNVFSLPTALGTGAIGSAATGNPYYALLPAMTLTGGRQLMNSIQRKLWEPSNLSRLIEGDLLHKTLPRNTRKARRLASKVAPTLGYSLSTSELAKDKKRRFKLTLGE